MSGHAYAKRWETQDYAQYMIHYPNSLAKEIMKRLYETNPGISQFDSMLDVGCGSGIATKLFTSYFRSITAFDISEAQIEKAKELNSFENIKYVVGSGEAMPADDESVDLIVCASAANWMNLKEFTKECNRVLKANCCAALFGFDYTDVRYCNNSRDMDCMNLSGGDLLHEYFYPINDYSVKKVGFEAARTRYSKEYDEIEDLKKERNDEFVFEVEMTLDGFKRFVLCIPVFYDYQQQWKDRQELDPLEIFGEKLKKRWNVSHLPDEDVRFNLTLSVFLIYLTKNHQ